MPKKVARTKNVGGRPAHAPTVALRRRVSIAAGGGMLHEHIAMALGISRETLRKHYQHELTVVAMRRREEVMQAQYQAALRKGTTSAARVYLAAQPEVEAPPWPEGDQPAAPAAAAPAPAHLPTGKALGKKEQAQAEALTAADGTDWDHLLPKPGAPLQ